MQVATPSGTPALASPASTRCSATVAQADASGSSAQQATRARVLERIVNSLSGG